MLQIILQRLYIFVVSICKRQRRLIRFNGNCCKMNQQHQMLKITWIYEIHIKSARTTILTKLSFVSARLHLTITYGNGKHYFFCSSHVDITTFTSITINSKMIDWQITEKVCEHLSCQSSPIFIHLRINFSYHDKVPFPFWHVLERFGNIVDFASRLESNHE